LYDLGEPNELQLAKMTNILSLGKKQKQQQKKEKLWDLLQN